MESSVERGSHSLPFLDSSLPSILLHFSFFSLPVQDPIPLLAIPDPLFDPILYSAIMRIRTGWNDSFAEVPGVSNGGYSGIESILTSQSVVPYREGSP